MFKKLQIALVSVILLLFLLTSCSLDGLRQNNDQNNNNTENNHPVTEPETNENAVWGYGIYLRVVIADGSALDVNEFVQKITNITDTPAIPITDIVPESKHELIFGKTNRTISQKAYNELEKIIGDTMEDGWLIYTENTSVAVVYTSAKAMNKAFDFIRREFYSKAELEFKESKVVSSSVFNLEEIANTERLAEREEAFAKIEASLGTEVRTEVEKLYTLYTPEIYKWIADLYDPGIGGFYFSNSGRDNLGFLPDIESTVQALNHLNTAGMFSDVGGYRYAISDEMKAALLNFAKSLQDPDDGYFYHPQWGHRNELVRDDYKNARRGRDLGWARSLIKALRGIPYWNTPAGDIGELGAPGVSQSALTNRLSASKYIAVSNVIAVSSNELLPPQLQSIEAWKTYIDSLNVVNDPYMAGNTLAAQHNEIANAGDEYINYLTRYLTEKQNSETGFWGEGVSYLTMNGFMKLSYSFFYYGRVIPGIEKALKSTMQILLTPDTDAHDLHICNTYNTWENFVLILDSAEKTGGEALVSTLRAKLIEKAPELISITYDKVKTHKREDGGFSYNEKRPCNYSQQAPVACATTIESDVNGTGLSSTAITSTIAQALGFEMPPLYVPADADVFLRLIDQRETIDKSAQK